MKITIVLFLLCGCGSTDYGGFCWAKAGKYGAVEAWEQKHDLSPKFKQEILDSPVYIITQSQCREQSGLDFPLKAFNLAGTIYVCSAWPRVQGGPNVPATEIEMVDRVVHEAMHTAWYFFTNYWGGDGDADFTQVVDLGRSIAQTEYLKCDLVLPRDGGN